MENAKDLKFMFGIALVSQTIVVFTRGPIYIWLAFANMCAMWEFSLWVFLMGALSLVAMGLVNFMFIFDGTKRVVRLGSLVFKKMEGKKIDIKREELVKRLSKTSGVMGMNADSIYGGQNFDLKDYIMSQTGRSRSAGQKYGRV